MVLAHEIAHHVHGDIWKGIAFESALIVAGFYLASRVLRAMAGLAGLRGVDDVAGLPLLLLAAGAVSLVMVPVGARDVARLRAQRRPLRARPDAEPERVHLGDAPPRRAESRRGTSVDDSCSGCSTAIPPSAIASPPPRPSNPVEAEPLPPRLLASPMGDENMRTICATVLSFLLATLQLFAEGPITRSMTAAAGRLAAQQSEKDETSRAGAMSAVSRPVRRSADYRDARKLPAFVTADDSSIVVIHPAWLPSEARRQLIAALSNPGPMSLAVSGGAKPSTIL